MSFLRQREVKGGLGQQQKRFKARMNMLGKRKEKIAESISEINRFSNDLGRLPLNHTIHWQMDRLAEECSELIQAVMKVKRYPNDEVRLQNLYEELSHVNICSSIILSLIGGKDKFRAEMDKKITQLEKTYARKD